jgi:hypothetical protein
MTALKKERDYRYFMTGIFEGEKTYISFNNGMVFPQDFDAYEERLWGLVNYVDEVKTNPNHSDPEKGLYEIAALKDIMFTAIDDVDRYIKSGGTFHKKELRKIRDHLDGRLVMLKGPILKLGSLIKKVNAIK